MKFVPFARLSVAAQEQVALASRPQLHLEPVVLHRENSTEQMVAIHMQIDGAHALLLADDLDDFQQQFAAAVAKLEAHLPEVAS